MSYKIYLLRRRIFYAFLFCRFQFNFGTLWNDWASYSLESIRIFIWKSDFQKAEKYFHWISIIFSIKLIFRENRFTFYKSNQAFKFDGPDYDRVYVHCWARVCFDIDGLPTCNKIDSCGAGRKRRGSGLVQWINLYKLSTV